MYLPLISQQSFAGLPMFWQLLVITFCPLRLELEHPSNRVSIVCSTLCAHHMVTSLQQTQLLSGYCQTGWDKASMYEYQSNGITCVFCVTILQPGHRAKPSCLARDSTAMSSGAPSYRSQVTPSCQIHLQCTHTGCRQ